jgi:DNA primase
MRFPTTFLDEIRTRLPVSHVVAKRVKLKRQGREFVGLSPFKQEKTPSFTVNDAKGFYHCFASGEHGDIFTFLMKTEGLGFHEAVEHLAQEAGLPVPKASPELEQRERSNDRLRALMEEAAGWFEAALAGKAAREARNYLDGRGVSEADRQRFRIGFAPKDRYAIKEHLAAKGFTAEEMERSGIVVAGEEIAVSYDRFRNRIIFPITDLKDRVIAFGGRALDPSHPAKYLNSPETPLFHKGSVLYNAARARGPAHDRGAILVVEGYMDVVALAGAGFSHAVAPLGTALTANQLQLLWRMAHEPTLCFDGDEAGQKAASRALDTALPDLKPGLSLRFAFLPAGQDPDDVLRDAGQEAFGGLVEAAQPLADVLWRREAARQQLETPERRAALEMRIEALLGQIGDPKVRHQYQQELRRRFERAVADARGGPRAGARGKGQRNPQRRPRRDQGGSRWTRGRPEDKPWEARAQSGASDSLKQSALVRTPALALNAREALILQTLLNHPWLLETYAEEVAELRLSAQPLSELRDAVIGVHALSSPLDSDGIRTQLNQQGFGAIVARVERAITHKSDGFAKPHASPHDVETGWRQVLALHRKALDLERELAAAEKAYRDEGTETAYEQLVDIRLQVLNAEGTEASSDDLGPPNQEPTRAA